SAKEKNSPDSSLSSGALPCILGRRQRRPPVCQDAKQKKGSPVAREPFFGFQIWNSRRRLFSTHFPPRHLRNLTLTPSTSLLLGTAQNPALPSIAPWFFDIESIWNRGILLPQPSPVQQSRHCAGDGKVRRDHPDLGRPSS